MKKNIGKALEILKEAKSKGILLAGYLYYDIFCETCDFGELMNAPEKNKIIELFNLLIDDIIIDSVYSYFEYFYLMRICHKHFKIKNEIDSSLFEYSKEFVEYLTEMTKGQDTQEKKKIIQNYFFTTMNYCELHLARGITQFYGVDNIIASDKSESIKYFKEAMNNSSNKSYKRFCFFYIFQVKRFLNDVNLNNVKKELFESYENSLSEPVSNLSSSFFYYISRLYHKKIGNNGNKFLELICLKRATEYKFVSPGTNSIISIYRKYKSKKLLQEYKDEYNKTLKKYANLFISVGYGSDNDICPICFSEKKSWIVLPCKHLFCKNCLDTFEKKSIDKCPICRTNIIIKECIENI